MSLFLKHASIEWGEDLTPRSVAHDDVYFSAHDGAEESRYVFLAHNDLPDRWAGQQGFAVGELGFGTGLNFLLTWDAWRKDPQRPRRLTYFSIERAPLRPEDIRRTAARWPELLPLAEELIASYPITRRGFHPVLLADGAITLVLAFGEAKELLTAAEGAVDSWYLDGFAPAKNPEIWEPGVLEQVARLSRHGTTFATFTAAAAVRRELERLNFKVEKFKGFGPKRESLHGSFNGAARETSAIPKTAAVVGAGIAGAAAAEALGRRGIQPTVFDRAERPFSGASGNHRGVLYPYFSIDGAPRGRLYDAGFDYSLRELIRFGAESVQWEPTGVLQFAATKRLQKIFAAVKNDPSLLGPAIRLLDPQAASAQAGLPLEHEALYVECAGVISPPAFGGEYLKRSGAELRFGEAVSKISPSSAGWNVGGSTFDTVVLTGGHEVTALIPGLELLRVRGQLAELGASARSLPLKTVLCYEGYAVPAKDGRQLVGASYDYEETSPDLLSGTRAELLAKLYRWTGDIGLGNAPDTGRVSFRAATSDRLPVVGPAGGEFPNVYLLTGFGSRGLSSIPLAAEALAARIAGEFSPIECELSNAVAVERITRH